MSKKSNRDKSAWPVIVGVLVLTSVIFILGRIAIVNSERRDAEKTRGDTLQQSIDALRQRSDEDRKFFETIRQLMISQNAEDRKKLIDELRTFKFTSPETTTTTIKASRSTTTTTTTSNSSPTTAPRPPPSTTTTTVPPPPPPSRPCVTTPVVNVCPQPPTSNERKRR